MKRRTEFRKALNLLAIFLLSLGFSASAWAGFTETLPQGMFMLDEAFVYSYVDSIWDNHDDEAPILEAIDRYEPGGGKQGVIHVRPKAKYMILINKLQYGILDDLSIGLGIPIVLNSEVDPGLSWETGDYQRQIGRPYSEDDFWAWAGSMGQSKPQKWSGNKGKLSDIVLGLRWQWTQRIERFQEIDLHSALSISGIIPTGSPADPEEVVSVGTTMYDLHTMGDLAFHLSFDKKFKEELDNRLTLGLDVFYETFFPRERDAAEGTKHPLLLTQKPYIGNTYTIKPGDFSGFGVQADVVPYRGPAWGTWLVDGDAEKAENLPPILTVSVNYTFMYLQQSDWRSNFDQWDWDKEKYWRPGYKNFISGTALFSFLRLGAPFQLYCNVRFLSLIPGKNTRAADVVTTGIQVPFKFW